MCMSLSETQLAGLKKSGVPITDEDLLRIFTALGLARAGSEDPDVDFWRRAISDQFIAVARAEAWTTEQSKRAWRLDMYVATAGDEIPVGVVIRIFDMLVLQRKGGALLAELFASVDDLAHATCPSCDQAALTWDGVVGSRLVKPGMECTSCGWKGHNGRFMPLREMR
jgi:hypothetical protein